jgi:hypothetical protein
LSSNFAGAAKTARAVCSDIDAQPANPAAIATTIANPTARPNALAPPGMAAGLGSVNPSLKWRNAG